MSNNFQNLLSFYILSHIYLYLVLQPKTFQAKRESLEERKSSQLKCQPINQSLIIVFCILASFGFVNIPYENLNNIYYQLKDHKTTKLLAQLKKKGLVGNMMLLYVSNDNKPNQQLPIHAIKHYIVSHYILYPTLKIIIIINAMPVWYRYYY